MNINANMTERLKWPPSIPCITLAVMATMLSLSVSVLIGWHLGISIKEKLVMAAFGALAVLGAHFLLAICRQASIWLRVVAIIPWLFCLAYVFYSHVNFFLSTQNRTAATRVAAIDQVFMDSEPKRNLSKVLSDEVKIKTELAVKSQVSCIDGCPGLKAKLINMKARLEVLNAEAEELKRWQAQHDLQVSLKDAAREDIVAMHMAQWLRVTATELGWVPSGLFFAILESLACLCWYITFQSWFLDVTQPVTVVPPTTIVSHTDVARPLSDIERQVEQLILEVNAGRLKLTVKSVQGYFRCAQKTASELRRLADAKLKPVTRAC